MKYVLIGLGVVVVLAAIVVGVGYSLPVKHHAELSAHFASSPDKVYGLITDVESFSAWRSGLKSAAVVPSIDGHKHFKEVSGNGTISYVVESDEPGRRVVTRIDDKSLAFGGTWTYTLLPADGGGTTLQIAEDGEIYNPVFRFVSRYFMGYDGTIKTYLADAGKAMR